MPTVWSYVLLRLPNHIWMIAYRPSWLVRYAFWVSFTSDLTQSVRFRRGFPSHSPDVTSGGCHFKEMFLPQLLENVVFRSQACQALGIRNEMGKSISKNLLEMNCVSV